MYLALLCRRLVRCLSFLAVSAGSLAMAAPYHVTFDVDPDSSSLTVEASTVFIVPFSDSDTQALDGTINVTLDFGAAGFGPTAEVTITEAAVSAMAPYNLTLGSPPFLGVAVTASGLVADVSTTSPPATMTLAGGPAVQYVVPASQFPITVNQGVVTATGAINDSIDLAVDPVSGISPPGSNATFTFTTADVVGPFTRINATLSLPLDVADSFTPEGGSDVEVRLEATVIATASFYAALNGIPGDFDEDGTVDGADLARWTAGYGVGSSTAEGDADEDHDVDGADLLVWQRHLGIAPPTIDGALAVPEPLTALLATTAAAMLFAGRRVKA